ncbi:MAG: galactose mutarotase [Eubacterium sp.]|nr:galactose mutarotase [Eubacterium sp.]
MNKENFGQTSNGTKVTAFTISNKSGMSATIIDFGATVTKLIVPDKTGGFRDVMLGYDNVASYENGSTYFGTIIGRNCNRINQGQVTIDGQVYQMDQNDNENNLHSGKNGVDKKMWTALENSRNESSVSFICKSNDMEQGLPGNVTITVTYSITEDNKFIIKYDAVSDKKTIINLTSHMYFNLNGHYKGDIENHMLFVNADKYNPVIDSKSIPTGENADVAGTVFDFKVPKKIGQDINSGVDQLVFVGGYDHNYIVNGDQGQERHFATVTSEESGIKMSLYSDQTGTQFYSGNFVGEQKGKGGFDYHNRSGFCLEPQYIPNIMNVLPEGDVDCPIFDKDEYYHSRSVYEFSTI